MADASGDDGEQCIALTKDGSRCTRPAQDDGFCYQHDESSDTIDLDESAADETAADEEADAGEEEPAEESTPEIAADESGSEGSSESVATAAEDDASPDDAAAEGTAADDEHDEAGETVDHDEIEGVIDPEKAADGDEATATADVAMNDGSAGRSGATAGGDDAGPARAAAGGPATGDLMDDLRERATEAEAWARRTGRQLERHARRAYEEGRVKTRDLVEKTRETVTPMVESAREEFRRLRARVAKQLSTYRK